MQFDTFLMERNQTRFENGVEINLTESGVHPCTIEEILPGDEAQALLRQPLGYGWTDGRPDLRAAIASWYPGASASNVLVTNGSSEATMITLMAMIDPGDKVLFAVPNFMQVDGLGRALGMTIQRLPLLADQDWQVDPDALTKAMDGVKLISVTNPGNPTGAVLSRRSREALLDAAQTAGAWLLVDEIYRGGEIDGPETETFYGAYPRVIVTSSLSKSFACPGTASRLDRRARRRGRGGCRAAGLHDDRKRNLKPNPRGCRHGAEEPRTHSGKGASPVGRERRYRGALGREAESLVLAASRCRRHGVPSLRFRHVVGGSVEPAERRGKRLRGCRNLVRDR
ncbi:pyridoxal phosphate-dependent aminotransferase [Microvirga tunisiensis]|uniref:8-amino-7-oxononanoate synthase n=1 Tax=Microvirga tunisiensis TaxID=2108360 RepID=A0A5N7MAI7_9HYPH|nr:pyridoxal phosphate-dependent aminotransferase [Microvirga tunisiensis]MPR23941.1 pyridoxal phosphate-dependent aminotransferase [Microvirga tunisiensis]